MIERLIEFSAKNRFLVLLLTGVALAGARVDGAPHPARRHSRPLGHAGHRLLALGPQPRHPRGPGHLPDRHRAARRAARQGDPRLLRLRLLVRLRHLRGRHRSLLGALARARVPEQDPAAPARGRAHRDRARTRPASAGCTSTRWSTRSGTHDLAAAAQPAGLVSALRPAGGAGRRRGGGGRRLRQAVPGQRRSRPAARLQRAARRRSSTRSARATTRSAAGCWSSPAPSTWCAGAATCTASTTSSSIVVGADAKTGTPILVQATSRDVGIGPDIRRGVADLDGLGDAVGGIVVMRHGENALAVIDRVKAQARGAEADACRAGVEIVTTYDRSGLIRALDRHAASHSLERGDGHRQPRHPALPLAHPVGDRADRHHSGLGLPRLHPALLHGPHARTSCRSPASPSRSACWSTAPSSRSRTPTSGSSNGSPAAGRATSTPCACRR